MQTLSLLQFLNLLSGFVLLAELLYSSIISHLDGI